MTHLPMRTGTHAPTEAVTTTRSAWTLHRRAASVPLAMPARCTALAERDGHSSSDVGLGDGAEVAGQQHLHGQDASASRRKSSVTCVPSSLALDVLGGGGQVAVQEVEDLGQAGGLRRRQLLRQRRQRPVADEERRRRSA